MAEIPETVDEIIARAIAESDHNLFWDVPESMRTGYRKNAHAAIEALASAGYEIRPTTATSLQFIAENEAAMKHARSVFETIDAMLSDEHRAELERQSPGYTERRAKLKGRGPE